MMSAMRLVALSDLQQFAAVNLLSDPGAVGGPVQVPSCVQVVFNWGQEDAKQAHNVLYGLYGGGFVPTSAIADTLTSALSTGAAWTALAGFLATSTQFIGVTLRDVNVPNQPLVPNTVAGPLGTSVSAPLPNEVAAVVTLRTAKTGRQFRGRSYIPGFATNALGTGNVIAPAAVTALNNWAQTWKGALSASGLTLVLGLKKRNAYVSPITRSEEHTSELQ